MKFYYFRCVNDYCSTIAYFSSGQDLSDPAVQSELAAELQFVVCETFDAYCMECASQGIHLEWRTSAICRACFIIILINLSVLCFVREIYRSMFVLIAKECPVGMEYTSCVSKCPRTCSTIYTIQSSECVGDCYPGCRCPEGTYLHNDECVEAVTCPCAYGKQEYSPGQSIRVGCNHW